MSRMHPYHKPEVVNSFVGVDPKRLLCCPICKNIFNKPYIFCSQGHTFCLSCIETGTQQKRKYHNCPHISCKENLLPIPIPNINLVGMLASQVATCHRFCYNQYHPFIEASKVSHQLPILIAFGSALPTCLYQLPGDGTADDDDDDDNESKLQHSGPAKAPKCFSCVSPTMVKLRAREDPLFLQSLVYVATIRLAYKMKFIQAYRLLFKQVMWTDNNILTIEDLCKARPFLLDSESAYQPFVLSILYTIMMQLGGVVLFDHNIQNFTHPAVDHIQTMWTVIVKMIFLQEKPLSNTQATTQNYIIFTQLLNRLYVDHVLYLVDHEADQDIKKASLSLLLDPIFAHDARTDTQDRFLTGNDIKNIETEVKDYYKIKQNNLLSTRTSPYYFENLVDKCKWSGSALQFSKHSNECIFQTTACRDCKLSVSKQSQQQHSLFFCQSRSINIQCPYPQCQEEMSCDTLKQHLLVCPKRRVVCEFAPFGCKFIGAYDHCDSKQGSKDHIELLMKAYSNVYAHNQHLLAQLQQQQQRQQH